MKDGIYAYGSSTEYFRDQIRGKSKSLKVLSQKLGYASPRLLEMICQGKRPASGDFLVRFRRHYSLTDQEFLFLQLLVKRDREAARGKGTGLIDDEIKTWAKLSLDKKFLDEKTLQMVSDWPHFVLKQYFRTKRKASPEQIAKALRGKLTPKQVTQVLSTLGELGIIQHVPEKNEIQPLVQKGLVSSKDLPSTAIRAHHKQMMERAIEALEEVSVLDREMLSLSLAFDRKNTAKVKNELREFIARIDRLYGEELAESVYQLNLQFFPHIL